MSEYTTFINSDEYEKWRMSDKLHIYPEHVRVYCKEGSPEEITEFFKEIQEQYPSMQYSTSIRSRKKLKNGLELCLVSRFLSKELNRMYCTWPPYYIRNEGKIL